MYRLAGYRSEQFELEIDPEYSDDNDFTALIGANGSGKSRLLGELARTATGAGAGERVDALKVPARVLAVSNMVTDAFPFVRQQLYQYRYLGLRQSSNSMTTGAIAASLGRFYAEILLDPRFSFSIDRVAARLGLPNPTIVLAGGPSTFLKSNAREIKQRLADELGDRELLSSGRLTFVDDRLRTLRESVRGSRYLPFEATRELDKLHECANALGAESGTLLDIMRRFYGLRFELQFVSSEGRTFNPSAGQSLLLSMLLRIVASILPDSLVLIDEPEIGLHPAWQSEFVNILRESLPSGLSSHFLLATHSPYVALSASRILMNATEHEQLLHSRAVRRITQLDTDHRGMSVDSLIYRVFGAHVIGSPSVNSDLTAIIGWLSDGARQTDLGIRAAAKRLDALAGPDTETLNDVLREYWSRA